MAYTQLGNDSAEVAAERALATNSRSEAVRNDNVQRVTHGDRTIEVPVIDHAKLGRPVDMQFERNKKSVESRLKAIGVMTATVVNFLPIPLVSDSTLWPLKSTHAKVRAPKDTEDFTVFTFADAHIEPTRQGVDSPLIAWEYHPIELASEYVRTNPKGVMSFIGIPSDLDDPTFHKKRSPEDQHHGMTYGQVFEQKRAEAIEWMQEQLRIGNEDTLLKRMPNPRSKFSARRLKALNLIAEMPTWVEKQRDVSVRIPNCPKCQKPCEPGAASCTNGTCGFIIDPEKAYKIGAIAEDDPALERLTRETVVTMGISDYVAETIDEKVIRLKTPGARKPLSEAAISLLEAEDAEQGKRARENAKLIADAIAKSLPKEEKKAEEKKPKEPKDKE